MHPEFCVFGEMLWDCLPAGRHPGGASLNLAAQLAQLGASVALLSAIGQDALGDELRQFAEARGIETQWLTRARPELPTSMVRVSVDPEGNATYEIVQPVAWDEILVDDAARAAVAGARGLAYGSLAARSRQNLEAIEQLLALPGPVKFFDVNLRPPHFEPETVLALARRADVIKVNEDELAIIAGWLRGSPLTSQNLEERVRADCESLAGAVPARRICVTRGARGALLWEDEQIITAAAPAVTVRDTVGAGDAFTAALMLGLTRGVDSATALAQACELGAYVASQVGATPSLPEELKARFHPEGRSAGSAGSRS